MPRLKFKNFSDLAFIQSIDKPRHFKPLLVKHRDYFSRQGIDVSKIRNGDGVEEVYDWEVDPRELVNLADGAAAGEQVRTMSAQTDSILAETPAARRP